jgi:hypothetical protein
MRADGDANEDGVVDGADLLVWQRELAIFQSSAASMAAPEPATWLQGLAAILAVAISSNLNRQRPRA